MNPLRPGHDAKLPNVRAQIITVINAPPACLPQASPGELSRVKRRARRQSRDQREHAELLMSPLGRGLATGTKSAVCDEGDISWLRQHTVWTSTVNSVTGEPETDVRLQRLKP